MIDYSSICMLTFSQNYEVHSSVRRSVHLPKFRCNAGCFVAFDIANQSVLYLLTNKRQLNSNYKHYLIKQIMILNVL